MAQSNSALSAAPTNAVETASQARLVHQVRRGSSEALGRLYDLFGARLHTVAYRLTQSVEDAEDVVQDVFLGLPAALRGYQHRGNLEGWLKTLTVRASLMTLRASRRRREHALPEPALVPARPVFSAVDRIQLQRALRRLTDTQRQVFMLRVEGYSHPEIAELIGISTGASKINLYRARQTLERLLA